MNDHERAMAGGNRHCTLCNASTHFVGLIAIDVGEGVEAWRFDCENEHTALVIYTVEIPPEDGT